MANDGGNLIIKDTELSEVPLADRKLLKEF